MSRQFNNVVKRGDRWFVRVMIPRDLRNFYSRREFLRALGTSDLTEARFKGFNVLAAIYREFQQVRATGKLPDVLAVDTILAAAPVEPAAKAEQPIYSAILVQTMSQAIRRGVPTIMEAFDQYAEDNPRKISADTLKQNRYVVRLFSEFLGKDPLVTAINKNAIRQWRRALGEWPVKANEVKELKGLTFPEALVVAR